MISVKILNEVIDNLPSSPYEQLRSISVPYLEPVWISELIAIPSREVKVKTLTFEHISTPDGYKWFLKI